MTNVQRFQLTGEISESWAIASPDEFTEQRLYRHEQNWKQARKEVALAYQAMSLALHNARAEQGKYTGAHHYMTEAKLVKFSLFGRFEKIEPDALSAHELALVQKVENYNAGLIAQGHGYASRKQELVAFASALRIDAINRIRPIPSPMPSETHMDEYDED